MPNLADEVMGERIIEHGPASPEGLHVTVPAPGDRDWPRTRITEHRVLTVIGLHGGAGATTVAALFGEDALDAGQGWPVADGWHRPLPTLNVLAVARTHHAGLQATDRFTQHWAAGRLTESRLIGLVLVDDGPALTEGQKRAVKRLLKKTPRGGHIPWIEQWRHRSPETGRLPGRLARLIKAFRTP